MDRATALDEALKHIEGNFPKIPKSTPRKIVAQFTNPITHQKFQLYFAPGNFDEWCIFLQTNAIGYERVPTDAWYFGVLNDWAQYLVPDYIYYDFIRIYEAVAQAVAQDTISLIERISFAYPDYDQACVIWTILYMGMIAEENKANKILGKRLKRLGVYQVLIEGLSPEEAANFSRGRSTLELAPHCNERGF